MFLNRRDALPGLERFLKLKKSLNSALKSYQLLNLVKKIIGNAIQATRHIVVEKLDL